MKNKKDQDDVKITFVSMDLKTEIPITPVVGIRIEKEGMNTTHFISEWYIKKLILGEMYFSLSDAKINPSV